MRFPLPPLSFDSFSLSYAVTLSLTARDPPLSTVPLPEKTATLAAAPPVCGSEFEEEDGAEEEVEEEFEEKDGSGRRRRYSAAMEAALPGGGDGGDATWRRRWRRRYLANIEGAGERMGFEGYFRFIT